MNANRTITPITKPLQAGFLKGEHTYIFRWNPGSYLELLEAIDRLADRADNTLTREDAAIMGHAIGQRIARENCA